MNNFEIALWSACLGIFLSYFTLSFFYTAYNRLFQSLEAVVYVFVCGAFVALASGWVVNFFPHLWGISQQKWLVLSASSAAAISALGLRGFLRAQQRDALIDRGMLVVVVVAAAQLLWLLLPPQEIRLDVMAMTLIVCAVIGFWLCLRAWLLGDELALAMTVACVAMVFAVTGLFAMALHMFANDLPMQVGTAVCAAGFIVITCHTLKRRHAEFVRMRRAVSMGRDRDLLTQLWTGAALIRKVDESVARAKRNRKEMAVICVELANAATLRQEFGNNGAEQVIYAMAARVRQASGSSAAAVGRYSDSSFVVVLDSVQRPGVLRTVGLRLAVALRRPYMLNAQSSSPGEFRADVGVGVARISPGRQATGRKAPRDSTQMGMFDSFSLAQDVLHEAAELALSARAFGSRAAIVDAYSRKTVPLESADLK
ncbi:7TM diverse intracellular signaling domain-containing protein [Variovorax sp. PCZ-1]|uniref:sensor domain-containing diguanylate cyclase n=1 Tax=Variovorax sp. PCZ-1 TaxID=2835533 RepID=UPI001BD0F97D|nr:7TM diverse intracellular signaling domain-containing protein [Variovorax sp. PCZ-1]MBS7809128.1 diguanylate cyclase [Variovorax sp. PCZ-1]